MSLQRYLCRGVYAGVLMQLMVSEKSRHINIFYLLPEFSVLAFCILFCEIDYMVKYEEEDTQSRLGADKPLESQTRFCCFGVYSF